MRDTRAATYHLNYPRAVEPDPYTPLGPNLNGEHLWPVTVEHDAPRPGMTRVGLSLIAPPSPITKE